MRSTVFLFPLTLAFVSAACTMEQTGNSDQDWKGKKGDGKKDDQPQPAFECGGGTSLPSDQYFIADGLCVRAKATNLGLMRQIDFAPNGDLYGVTRDGIISRFRDLDRSGMFEDAEREVFAQLDGIGNNVEIDQAGRWLYAGGASSVKRFALDQMPCQSSELVVSGIPAGGQHPLHTVHIVGNFLYVHVGSAENASAPMSPNYDTNRSVIRRFDLTRLATLGRSYDWAEGEVFVKGIRNTVGFRGDAQDRIYAVDNGLDDLFYQGRDVHAENPGENVLLLQQGAAYGYPYCFSALKIQDQMTGNFVTPGTQLMTTVRQADGSIFTSPNDNAWCAANAMRADTLLPAHTAPLDIIFNDGPMMDVLATYTNGAFVTLHGSWDRPTPMGYEVVFLPRDANGRFQMPTIDCNGQLSFSYKVIFGGGTSTTPSEAPWGWSNMGIGETLVRPVGMAINPLDGSLWVTSDNAPVFMRQTAAIGQGALYRIQAAEKKDKK